MIVFKKDDGGRGEAGFKGMTGDCACRAIAIATGRKYELVYKDIISLAKKERIGKRKRKISHPRTGVYKQLMHLYLVKGLGWSWTPTMLVGGGCKVHVRTDELPSGSIILRLSRHYTAVVDGVLHDTYDCSRDGERCVYGYWS